MKQYTHAWLAFKAIERLEIVKGSLADNYQVSADSLIKWFMDHRDSVIQGAWYPDMVIKDMSSSHVLKFTPAASDQGDSRFKKLPGSSSLYKSGKKSIYHKKPYIINKNNNLPDRCESIAHSVIDNLKMQEWEGKGSPISPTNNHVAMLLFMLSHYVADAHMPLHCDSRRFSSGHKIHALIEGEWDSEMEKFYSIDTENCRFFYDARGYPKRKCDNHVFQSSFLNLVEDEMKTRKFYVTWGGDNGNVWDYMTAICQYSYLLSYEYIPIKYTPSNVTPQNWQSLDGQKYNFKEFSVMVFSDAIDSIARVWMRIWHRYLEWEKRSEKG